MGLHLLALFPFLRHPHLLPPITLLPPYQWAALLYGHIYIHPLTCKTACMLLFLLKGFRVSNPLIPTVDKEAGNGC